MADDWRAQLEELRTLNRHRYEYIWERSKTDTIQEALQNAGRSESWYYTGFPPEQREQMERIAACLRIDRIAQAELTLRDNVAKAADVKVDGLDSKREDVRQKAATEVLDRVIGPPTQKSQNDHRVELVVRYE